MRFLVAAGRWVIRNHVQLWLNVILGAYFLAMIPVSLTTNLKHSVPFLVAISLWALVAAHWSAALAALAAIQAERANGG